MKTEGGEARRGYILFYSIERVHFNVLPAVSISRQQTPKGKKKFPFPPKFIQSSSRIALVYQSVCSRTIADRLQYNWIAKKMDGFLPSSLPFPPYLSAAGGLKLLGKSDDLLLLLLHPSFPVSFSGNVRRSFFSAYFSYPSYPGCVCVLSLIHI